MALIVGGTEVTSTAAELNLLDGKAAANLLDWSADQGGTDIHSGNYTDTNSTGKAVWTHVISQGSPGSGTWYGYSFGHRNDANHIAGAYKCYAYFSTQDWCMQEGTFGSAYEPNQGATAVSGTAYHGGQYITMDFLQENSNQQTIRCKVTTSSGSRLELYVMQFYG
jgi:hypothetical protein